MLSRLMTVREQLLLFGLAIALVLGAGTLLYLRTAPAPVLVAVETAKGEGLDDASPTKAPSAVSTARPVPTSPANLPSPGVASVPPQPAPAAKIAVACEGAVRREGVYELESGQRVRDLIARAGGTLDNADLSDIKMTALLMDDSILTVPFAPAVQRGDNSISVRRPPNARALNPPQYTKSGSTSAVAAGPAKQPAPSTASQAAPPSSTPGLVNLNTATVEELEALPGIGPAYAAHIIEYRSTHPFESVDDLDNVPGIGEKRLEVLRPLVAVQ